MSGQEFLGNKYLDEAIRQVNLMSNAKGWIERAEHAQKTILNLTAHQGVINADICRLSERIQKLEQR